MVRATEYVIQRASTETEWKESSYSTQMEQRTIVGVTYSLKISHNQLLKQLINYRKAWFNLWRPSTSIYYCFLQLVTTKWRTNEIVWQGKHQGHIRLLEYLKSIQIFNTVFCKMYSNEKTSAWKLCSSVDLFGITNELHSLSSRLWYLHSHSRTYTLYAKCYTGKHNICHMKTNLCLLCIFRSRIQVCY